MQMLTWLAFLTLPYSGTFDARTGTVCHERASVLWEEATSALQARGQWAGPRTRASVNAYQPLDDDDETSDDLRNGGHVGVGGRKPWTGVLGKVLAQLRRARNVWRVLLYPQLNAGRLHTSNRLWLLLKWDAVAFGSCAALLLVAVVAGEASAVERAGTGGATVQAQPTLAAQQADAAASAARAHEDGVQWHRPMRRVAAVGEATCRDACTVQAGGYIFALNGNGICDESVAGSRSLDLRVVLPLFAVRWLARC
jgi:hypothetical protein